MPTEHNENSGSQAHGNGQNGHGEHQTPHQPGRPKIFKIQIDKKPYDVNYPNPTGRQLLILAGKTPPEQWGIYLRGKGQPQRIGLDETVNLEEPGVERFVTLPLDQTEGKGAE